MIKLDEQINSELDILYQEVDCDPEAKIAFCGICRYNNKLRKYCIDNYYPFCRCVKERQLRVIKCGEGQPDNEGTPLPKDYVHQIEIPGNLEFCPKGYYLKTKLCYDVMIYESSEFLTPDQKIMRKIRFILKLNERLRGRFHDFISIRGAFYHLFLDEETKNIRYKKAFELEQYKMEIEDLYLENINNFENSTKFGDLSFSISKFEWLYSDT